MLIHTGNPPKHPEMILAIAKTLLSVFISPSVPYPLNLFPRLSNSSKYKNCSKIRITVITKLAGKTSMI